jgi:hypothetical protein
MVNSKALAPLQEDRRHVQAILALLHEANEPEVLADLAGELVRACARSEDSKSQVLYPLLRSQFPHEPDLDDAEKSQQLVRDATLDVHRRTLLVKPLYAHADDPEGFEHALDTLMSSIHRHLDLEEHHVLPLVSRLDDSASDALHTALIGATAWASTHPDPHHNRIGRVVANTVNKIEHRIHDASTPWNPGIHRSEDRTRNRSSGPPASQAS